MKITGKGIPTRKTAGAIGDIYTDTLTGANYECTFAYSPGGKNDYDYEWKPMDVVVGIDISNGPDVAVIEEECKENSYKKPINKEKKQENASKTDEEPIPEKNETKKQPSKNRVNYARAYDADKKETK